MGLVFLAGCRNSDEDVAHVTMDFSTIPVIEQRGAVYTFSDSAAKVLSIEAGHVLDYAKKEPPYLLFKDGVVFRFFNEGQPTKSYLRADSARNEKETDLWIMGGNVAMVNASGERMETPLLHWDRKENRVWSDTLVTVISDGQIITGTGFESNREMQTYRIFNVQGEITVDDE